LTTVESSIARPDPSTVVARTQRAAGVPSRRPAASVVSSLLTRHSMTPAPPPRATVRRIATFTSTAPSPLQPIGELTADQTQVALVVVAGLVALVVVAGNATWRIARNVVTIAHEGGHALVAIASGRTLTRILLHSDTSGVTVSKGRRDGPGMAATAFAGYATPPLLGLGAAALVAGGAVPTMLGLAIMVLLGTLVLIRNVYGAASVVLTGGVVVVVIAYGSPTVQYGFACFVTWFLIVGGLKTVLEVQQKRVGRRAADSDPDQLERLTGVPAGIFVAMFALIGVLALIFAGNLLLSWPPLP
jgi:peptidase M50B-like protein